MSTRNSIRQWLQIAAAVLGVTLMLCLSAGSVLAQGKDDKDRKDDKPDTLQASKEPKEIQWMTDYSEAVDKAGRLDRHIITEFYTDWCKWCKKMDDSTFTDSAVIAMGKKFLFLRVNAEVDTSLANRFHVSGYPTVILLEKGGSEVDRVLGYKPPPEFAETMEGYLEGKGTYWSLEKDNREKPNDPEVMFLMGKKKAERGNPEEARAQFERVVSLDKKNSSGYADDAQFQLGLMQRRDHSWYKAIEAFRSVIKNYPESELTEDAQLYIGWLYAKAGDTKEALKSYKEFLKQFSKSSETDWVKTQIQKLEDESEDKS